MLHHRIQNRLEITGNLTLKTAVHVGGSTNEGRGLSKVIKDIFERPFLPGSSMKGVLRSRVEALAHLVLPHDAVCYQEKVKDESHSCLSAQKGGIRKLQNELKDTQKSEAQILAFIQKHLCPACQLFGGASWRSKVSLDDLHPIANMVFPLENRDGVGIDRDTRQAAPSVKYQYEAVPAGAQFGFRLVAENLGEADMALLSVGILDLLTGHFSIGGKTSRGLGEVILEDPMVQFWDAQTTAGKRALLMRTPAPIAGQADAWFRAKLELEKPAV